MVLHATLLALIMFTNTALPQDEFRDDFEALDEWEALPDWLGAPAARPHAQVADGVAHFHIEEPNRGMKWRRELPQVDTEFGPWLVIRYRAEGYAADRVDYVLWLGDSGLGRDGLRLMIGDHIRADGHWHTRAFDLEQAGAVSPINAMAVQCFADADGDASLWVDYIAFTDSPPRDAEGYEAPVDDGQTWEVAVDEPEEWTVQPTWLANYSAQSRCEATPAGTRFAVEEPGRGAKWSRDLPEAIPGARWVSMRYRATGMRGGTDYALYVGSEPGGRAREEQYLITLGDIIPDNTWRVAVARVEVSSIKTLAAQVQARAESASLEIARLTFHEGRPVIRLADEFECEEGWPADLRGFRPLDLPPGNLDGPGLARKLRCEGWIPEGRITAQGVPFTVRTGADAVIMTAVREPGEIALAPQGRAAEAHLLLAAQLPGHEEPAFFGGRMSAIRQVERFVARIEYADGTSEEQFPLQVSRGEHQVARGLHVYSLALEPDRDVARIVLRDGMRRGAFGLVAATLSDNPGPATEATRARPALTPPPERPVAARRAGITRDGERIIVEAWTLTMTLDCARGLRVAAPAPHVPPPGLDATVVEYELVVARAQVGMVGVNERVEVRGVVALELVHKVFLALGVLLVPDGLDVGGHVGRDIGGAQGEGVAEALHLPRLLPGHVGKQLSALADLADRLVEGDADPLVLAAPAGALEHAADAVRVIRNLHARLALGADGAVHGDGLGVGRGVIQVGEQGPGVVRVAVNLGEHAVLELAPDAAAGVAVQAGGVDDVLATAEVVGGVGTPGDEYRVVAVVARGGARRAEEGAAQQGAVGKELAAGEGFWVRG